MTSVPMPSDATRALFTPVRIGALELPNRLVMAPLTRLRAGKHGVPGDLIVEHYRQRASLGLIITEGTWPVKDGRTWIGQPGIETLEQQDGWARVADAVHAEGGRIAMQIMHGGRVSHPALTESGRIVSASATAGVEPIRIPSGKAAPPIADALSTAEIPLVVAQFVAAARRAVDAGMDMVELHGANGYLINQFFSPVANLRDDGYGGTPANRARFAIEVLDAVVDAIGADHTGVRISPAQLIQGMDETEPGDTFETYVTFAEAIARHRIAFLDILHADPASELVQGLRGASGVPLIANTGFASPTAQEEAAWIIEEGLADAVGVGRPAIANPDLPMRWQHGLPENELGEPPYYGDGARGYNDFPTYGEVTT